METQGGWCFRSGKHINVFMKKDQSRPASRMEKLEHRGITCSGTRETRNLSFPQAGGDSSRLGQESWREKGLKRERKETAKLQPSEA